MFIAQITKPLWSPQLFSRIQKGWDQNDWEEGLVWRRSTHGLSVLNELLEGDPFRVVGSLPEKFYIYIYKFYWMYI